jgi:hypothetical protein
VEDRREKVGAAASSLAAFTGRFTGHRPAFVIRWSAFSGSRFSVHDSNSDLRIVNTEV